MGKTVFILRGGPESQRHFATHSDGQRANYSAITHLSKLDWNQLLSYVVHWLQTDLIGKVKHWGAYIWHWWKNILCMVRHMGTYLCVLVAGRGELHFQIEHADG